VTDLLAAIGLGLLNLAIAAVFWLQAVRRRQRER
jgi:hypothetical protein